MASRTNATGADRRFSCDHPNCKKSYLRSEHLNRHRLTHKERAFACYFCKRQFTRNDLLQVHLRRHEDRNLENHERARYASPPHQGHRDALLRRTNPLWDEDASMLPVASGINLISPTPAGLGLDFSISSQPQVSSSGPQVSPHTGLPGLLDGRGLFDALDVDFSHLTQIDIDEVIFEEAGSNLQFSDADYERTMTEFPNLVNTILRDCLSMQSTFEYGLQYLELSLPFLHSPTLHVPNLSPLLILAICCLGGLVDSTTGVDEVGKVLEDHLMPGAFAGISEGTQVQISTLQALVIIEQVGYYGPTRKAHETANVLHGMIVALAGRSNLLAQCLRNYSDSHGALDSQWKAWAQIEGLIRLAHCIFVADVSRSLHFTNTGCIPTAMLKLPLPCAEKLWLAQKAVDLALSLEVLLSNGSDHSTFGKEEGSDGLDKGVFTMSVMISGLASEILELNRSLPSASSKAIRLLKSSDLKAALNRWHRIFERMDPESRKNGMSVSALTTWHSAFVFLEVDFEDVKRACRNVGIRGRADFTSSSDEQGFDWRGRPYLVRISAEARGHALDTVRLCLQEQKTSHRALPGAYSAFVCALILWSQVRILEYQSPSQDDDHDESRADSQASYDGQALGGIIARQQIVSTSSSKEIQSMKSDVLNLMRMVRDRLENYLWEIGHEASQILDELLENYDSGP